MYGKSLTWLLAGALLSAAGLLVAAQNNASAPPPGGAVVTVNLDRCIQEHPPFKADLDRLRGDFDAVVKEFQEREKKIKELEAELAVMERGTDAYVTKAYDVEREKFVLDRDNKFQLDRLNARRIEIFLKAYPRIEAAAAAVGARQGYAAVLTLPPPLTANEVQADPVGAFEKLQQRPLLWANTSYDVTGLVIEELRQHP